MQVAPSGGQICNLYKWLHLVAKFATYASGAMLLPNLVLVTASISGSVVPLAMFNMLTMATRVPVGAKKVKQKGLLWCLSVLPISGFQLSAPLTHHHHHQTSYLSFSQHYHGSVDFNTVGMYFMTHHHHHARHQTSYLSLFLLHLISSHICLYQTKYLFLQNQILKFGNSLPTKL